MPISLESCAAQHIGDRCEQQDRLALVPHPSRPGLLMAVVADGMGGHTGGALAAEQVVLKARQNFSAFMEAESAQELLRAIIEESNVVINLTRFTSEQDPHSTAAVLVIQPERIDWAHCGDSRIYHFRDGLLIARTEDHSLVNMMLKQGRITSAEAATHPQRNVLVGYLGAEGSPVVSYGECLPPFGNDIFVVCSDGLWGYLSDGEIGHIIAGDTPRAAAEQLVQLARARGRGSGDNISLVIIKLVRLPEVRSVPAPPVQQPQWTIQD